MLRSACPRPAAQDGFLLVEVLVSTLFVALIVVATFNGFDVVTRSTAEQRRRNEAAVLATQSQEQLRTDSAIALNTVAAAGAGRSYPQTVDGTTFTITQKASFGTGAEQTGCNASETGHGKGVYVLISSSVTWPHIAGKAVSQSSIITPPTGSGLEVDVSNGELPTAGVPVIVKYTAVEAHESTTVEGTTNEKGCVLFTGIPSTSAIVEVKESQGIVNKHGTLSWPPEQVTLAPNVVTHHPITMAPGGRITAQFTYNSSSTYSHPNNAGTKEVTEEVKGDTFIAFNPAMQVPPEFETASNGTPAKFAAGGIAEVLPGAPGTYANTATTPTEPTLYPNGNLFPFAAKEPSKAWAAFAGDCRANNPEEFNGTIKLAPITVTAKEATTAPVTTSYLQLEVYGHTEAEVTALGANAWKDLETSTSYLVTITNKRCAGITPNNETALNDVHTQRTTINTGTSEWGGHLEDPFQPFGEYELCLFNEKAGGRTYRLKNPYTNSSPTVKTTRKIYLTEPTAHEKEEQRLAEEEVTRKAREATEAATAAAREAKEAATAAAREATEKATREAREKAEAPAREKREAEEKTQKTARVAEETAKTTREAKEATERATWKTEETSKKINKKEREAKEKTQKTAREAIEKTEKTARTKRESEEATTKAKREAEETTKATKVKEEETTKATKVKEEEAARTTRIAKEAAELAGKEVVVESGASSC